MRTRERKSDLSPRMRELEALIARPRTIKELSQLMRCRVPTLKAMMSQLKKKREVRVIYDYGATTYEIFDRTRSAP